MIGPSSPVARRLILASAMVALVAMTPSLNAQQTGTIAGRAVRTDDGTPIVGALISLQPANLSATTNQDGRFRFERIPVGTYTLQVRSLLFRQYEVEVVVGAGDERVVEISLESVPVRIGEVVVIGASRGEERLLETPSAVSRVDPKDARDYAPTSQVPAALASLPGVELVQSGINEFNLNARGFNTTLNRRVLVLQDGRDLSIAFLGSQEWTAMALPLDDLGSIEFIRGPNSALYGANAFGGVLSIVTPAARDIQGTKISLGGGSMSSVRGDLRHAGVLGNGRFGYRVNVGYSRSDSWSLSRTNLGDMETEYSNAIDTTEYPVVAPTPGFELRAVNGQTTTGAFGTPSPATGDPDPVVSAYGSARVDYYVPGGSMVTAEGGYAQVENEIFITAIGRAQVTKSIRPWGRLNFSSENFRVMGWYSGRNSVEPQYSLASGGTLEEQSHILHGEAQYNRRFLDDRGRVVVGGSIRSTYTDGKGTILAPQDDKRTDGSYSAYGQLEYTFAGKLRAVGAARWDNGDLFPAQFSPRGAIVFSPTEEHAVRLSAGRGFQTPTVLEKFLNVPVGPPADFSALEAGLRASPLGPALAGVTPGTLYTNSAAVPALGLGNTTLDVEHVTNVELGYKGLLGQRVFVSIDGYIGRLSDFVTDLLPGVNPNYAPWTAPVEVPESARPAVEQATRDGLIAGGGDLAAAGLTRLEDGSTAIVVSYGNAGVATERGIEVGAGVQITEELIIEGNYTLFDADIDASTLVAGDLVLPNTARHRGNLIAAYRAERFDARASLRLVDGYDWATGIFAGRIPSLQTIDVSGGFNLTRNFRVYMIVTNLLDQQRYQMFGGSLIGRRALGGLTVTF